MTRLPSGIVGCALVALAAFASEGHAQDARVGITAGGLTANYDAPATVSFSDRTGYLAGIFADVLTPVGPLRVRVEGRWVRRGGDLVDGGGAEMDLLDVPLSLGVRFPVGPMALRPSVGFALAYPLRVRSSADIDAGFGDSARTDATGFVAAELEIDLPRALRLGAEIRSVRGLGASFEGPGGRLETRSTEFLIRLSRPVN